MKDNYLITGICGTGKTWLMKQLINAFNANQTEKVGLYHYNYNDVGIGTKAVAILGKYDGTMFEGSDRFAMNIMADNDKIENSGLYNERIVIAEGDRFTNNTYITKFKPMILRILGDGADGRVLRGSSQTERHLKSITTRVNNIEATYEFDDSTECLDWLLKTILEPNTHHYAKTPIKKAQQNSLF